MSDDNFDDGLVHSHGWAAEVATPAMVKPLVADADGARTPSTVHQDEHVLPG